MSVALPHVRGPGFAASAAGIAIHGKAGRLRHASTGCEQYRAKYGEKRTTGRIIIQAHQLCPMAFMSSSDMVDMSWPARSEEHTSELQSLMRNSYAVFCLKKKNTK